MSERWADRVDFGRTAADYARHRQGFPDELFARLSAFEIGEPGHDVVDLGTGTGTLARGFATRGCAVVGIDPSVELVGQARALDAAQGVTVDYRQATAEETGLATGSADVVTAGQCWHWFHRSVAAAEARRVLRPGGSLVIAHLDWIPLAGNVAEATEELILAYNPAYPAAGGFGMYPRWTRGVSEAGFVDLESFSFDLDLHYTHEAWRGRIRASAGVAAELDPAEVEAFDRDLAALLAHRFPEDPVAVRHRVWALISRSPG